MLLKNNNNKRLKSSWMNKIDSGEDPNSQDLKPCEKGLKTENTTNVNKNTKVNNPVIKNPTIPQM